jgi:hypothetical protein
LDKYTTIRNILQAGVTALETIENPKPEDTPKDVISLIKLISHKLTITEHKQDARTIENHLEHLNQKIDHLTKTLLPPYQNQNAAISQQCKQTPHTTHTTPRKQPNPQNPLARHHPSRLTIIFESPPPTNKRNNSARIFTNVNNSLALAKLEVRIAGVTWSLAGNCILLTREGHLATNLKPHAMSITHFLTKNPIPIKDINEDKLWPRIVIDGVDTGISTWDKNPSPHPMTHILSTLHADNPWFTNIKLKEQPRWLCGSDHIGNKKHSSIVSTLEDQESLKELIDRKTIFGWRHPIVRGHPPVSLPSLSTPPLSYTPLSSPTLTPVHMYTPPLSVPSLGARFSMPTTPGPQRHPLVHSSTTTVCNN